MFHKMPLILITVIITMILLDPIIPFILKQALYSISLTIQALIVLLLPFIIFSLLFKASVTLSNSATKIIGVILALVCCSNFLSTFLSHYVGEGVYDFELSMLSPKGVNEGLKPLWLIKFPTLIANSHAMFAGIVLGVLAHKFAPTRAKNIARIIENIIGKILNGFVYIIPLFVLGFVVKLQLDGVVKVILKDYTLIFILIALAQFSYITLTYFVLSNFRINECMQSIKNILPAAISGFSTMSSAASMPLTIIGAENNAHHKDVARSVIPLTVNIHLVGDCFAIPILAYAILKGFNMPEPSLFNYLIFTLYFVLAKFSVASIPGGGIIVMLPILESYLGFNSEMMSLITGLYILFDPVITCANVLGNGAFAKMMDNILKLQSLALSPKI